MSIRTKRGSESTIDYLDHLYVFAIKAGNPDVKATARRLYTFHWPLVSKIKRDNHWRHLPHPSKLPD